MSFDPGQIIAGAALGFVSAGTVRWWQYRRDGWIARVESFLATLEDAADTATEQWLFDSNLHEEGRERAEALTKLRLLEARTLGLQVRMDGIYESIRLRFCEADQQRLKSIMNLLTVAMTGGDFGADRRPADLDSARLAQLQASELMVVTRVAVDKALTLSGLLTFLRERADRRYRGASEGLLASE